MKIIGTARFFDLEGYLAWYGALSDVEADEFQKSLAEGLKHTRTDTDEGIISEQLYEITRVPNYSNHAGNTRADKWPAIREENLKRIRRFLAFAQEFNQPLNVGRWEDEYAYLYIGNPEEGIIVPTPGKYLDFTPEKDYTGITPAELKAALGQSSEPGAGDLVKGESAHTLTVQGLAEVLESHNEAMGAVNKELEAARNYETKELAELKAQINAMEQQLYAKRDALMAELRDKMADMELKKTQMEAQIFVLESQIYSIRCYAGEVVKFTKIRSGKNAPETEPIVIHQKLRFLDEDLARLASLYEIEWEELELFEQFLRHSPLALDTFAPNERCVLLVRLSRTGRQQGRDYREGHTNMLRNYKYFHGNTVGIIIRNGENIYLGWTDENKVHISDDLIISQTVTEILPVEEPPEFRFESDRKEWMEKQILERKQLLDGIVSRRFIFNIVQGIVDNSDILPLPEGVNIGRQSEYVIYSMADKWLTDNRFGSFTQILEDCNAKVTQGDMLLTVQHLIPDRGGYGWGRKQNDRGRGYADRTHDCSVEDCHLYKANLVEYDEPESMTRFRRLMEPHPRNPEGKPYWQEDTMTTERFENYRKNFSDECEVLEVYDYRKPHVFVSVPKTESSYWRDTDARANFELYNGEYINLTYLNSVWLEWVVTNKKLGGWTVGGKAVDYAYAIRYVKTALDYIRKREVEEKALIDALDPAICTDPDWPIKLSKWKLEKGVRAITEYQAKRFVKHVKMG